MLTKMKLEIMTEDGGFIVNYLPAGMLDRCCDKEGCGKAPVFYGKVLDTGFSFEMNFCKTHAPKHLHQYLLDAGSGTAAMLKDCVDA